MCEGNVSCLESGVLGFLMICPVFWDWFSQERCENCVVFLWCCAVYFPMFFLYLSWYLQSSVESLNAHV